MDAPEGALRVLVLCTGSVACVKVPRLVERLRRSGAAVRVVATSAALHFLHSVPDAEREGVLADALVTDSDEWSTWGAIGDPVLHIELRRWADVAVLAPLDANTLAKLAHGICDNLVTCVMRAWSIGEKGVVVAPAMNTAMYIHPATGPQLETLERWYAPKCIVVPPVTKTLACGDSGVGAMASVDDIVAAVMSFVC